MAILASSCEKEGTQRFNGYYTYNMSGSVTLQRDTLALDGTVVERDTIAMAIASETGQMDILTVDKSGGNMVLTMRSLGGTVTVADAVASGKNLLFTPFTRRFTLNPQGLSILKTDMDLRLEGYAERYSDVVIFRMDVSGRAEMGNSVYEVIESEINWVARLN